MDSKTLKHMIWLIRKNILQMIAFPWRDKSVKRAVILGIAAAFCYSIMVFLVKLISGHVAESITVFIRFAVSLFWIIFVLGYKRLRGEYFTLKTKHPGLHLLRAFSGFVTIFSLYIALKYVPLVDANLLAMTYTLFIPLLSFIFLGTRTSTKNWLVLLVGFVGIIFILKPCGGVFNPMMLVALVAGFASAVSFLGVHELAKDDSHYTIMLYYFPLTFVLSGVFSIFNWRTPDLITMLVLIMIGIVATAYQELLTRALLCASPKIVSPILYLSVVFSGFLGWLFWGYVPDLFFLLGIILVILGCVFSIFYAQQEPLPPEV
ncbi:S-adenosylmethionine uptake transporter [Gammaproteobacteria bacterium]